RRLLSRSLAAAAYEPLGPLYSAVAVGHQPLGCGAVEPVPDAAAWSAEATGFDDERAGRTDHHCQWFYRRIARYDHLYRGDTRHSPAFVLCRRSRRRRHSGQDPFHHASGAALADQLRDHLPDALAVGELRIHSPSYQRRPV